MGIDNWIENGYGDRDRYEESLSSHKNPDRCTALMSIPCLKCGQHLTECHFADGHRAFMEHGVVHTPDGVHHRVCPDPE
jgi:hypothetical protein